MISKVDITDRARQWQLRADVVEKDYVLGWILAAVAHHEEASTNWVLKGGTCIKKCFVETYRFSEDRSTDFRSAGRLPRPNGDPDVAEDPLRSDASRAGG